MKNLEQSLMNELNAGRAPRYLLAVCDQAALDESQRERIKRRFKQRTYSLLQDPLWEALFPYSALLVAAHEATTAGHRALLEAFGADQDYLPIGWIVSAVPGEQLATHLAQATVAHRPKGEDFLLRYFDPFVLPTLYQHANRVWREAFMAPIASWWVPRADAKTERWGRIAGKAMSNAPAPSTLLIDDLLWHALIADPLPHRMLQAIQKHSPSLFDTRCPGVRLARIEALLSTARNAGLTQHDDLHDYVFIALARKPSALEADRNWQHAMRGAMSGAGRLGELYLALQEQPAQRSR
ncbi:DUF4123 domain-containing protein [Pseudomonas entomophila]|uniref:DUF4123 domain-containing protein n=1 Tax=Pseudomonas entomophila TaxID=312306 RepID=UPI0023D7E961|nr:DUF4123 domain-containing protein [Pseudomonas entomophila]MDF0729248.1 DUF4123 domain-containing protein [Pseudomonas entomophila]